MAKIFRISTLNPFRFVLQYTRDARYNTLPFDEKLDDNNIRCFKQKWQTNDTAKVQFLSEYEDIELNFFKSDGEYLLNVPIADSGWNIIDQTFKAYEGEVDFSLFDAGDYYGELTYVDEDLNTVQYLTPTFTVAELHPDSLLWEYRNTFNYKNVIFDTGIVFNIRADGRIGDFDPQFDYESFADQEYDVTRLSSTTYRKFTMQLAKADGVPDWLLDKMNEVMNVDTIKIDGQLYQTVVDGAKWNTQRADAYPDAIATLDIVETTDKLGYPLETGDNTPGEFIVVQKNEEYYNQSANLTIGNRFKNYSHLTRCVIYNKNLDTFTLNIGTTNGGSQLGSFAISDATASLQINYAFQVTTTVYLTGLAGTLCDIFIDWKQYDLPPVNVNLPNNTKFVKGTVYMYEELNEGDFELHWNNGTGEGLIDTDYEGCVLSGTNGTFDRAGLLAIGYNRLNTAARDTRVGNVGNTIIQQGNQVGRHQHTYPNSNDAAGSGKVTTGGSATEGGPYYVDFNLPADGVQPMNISNDARVTVFFVYKG